MPALGDRPERREDEVDDGRRESERRLVEQEDDGLAIRARAIASCCCCPPDRAPACRSPELLAHREQLVDLGEILLHALRVARAASPSRRFSSTVSSAKSRRPSGTSATPLRATASGRPPAKRPLAERDVAGARRDELP